MKLPSNHRLSIRLYIGNRRSRTTPPRTLVFLQFVQCAHQGADITCRICRCHLPNLQGKLRFPARRPRFMPGSVLRRAGSKMIAEAWDAAGLYQVGTLETVGRSKTIDFATMYEISSGARIIQWGAWPTACLAVQAFMVRKSAKQRRVSTLLRVTMGLRSTTSSCLALCFASCKCSCRAPGLVPAFRCRTRCHCASSGAGRAASAAGCGSARPRFISKCHFQIS